MEKKKLIILFLAITFSWLSIHAQTLVIWQKDGSKVYYNLDDQPKTTFTADDLVITTAQTTINYPLAKILRYTYEDSSQGINDTKELGICITHRSDEVIVTGLQQGKTIFAYGADGKQLISKRSDGSKRQVLSLSQLPTGVYVIKAETVNYKFTKR